MAVLRTAQAASGAGARAPAPPFIRASAHPRVQMKQMLALELTCTVLEMDVLTLLASVTVR